MTKQDILRIAMAQSACDIGCRPDDFLKSESTIVEGVIGVGARAYYKEPIACNLVSYGNNVVASVKTQFREIVTEYVHSAPWYHLFATPNILGFQEKLAACGQTLRHMAYYFLPDPAKVTRLSCPYSLRLLTPKDFTELYLPQWSNALCSDRPHLDVLGIGAYDGEQLIGFAACSADCASMWQIGVDVLPAYRRRGVAAAVTSNLAVEIMARGIVPFYCCAWANTPSAGNAVKSGFVPAWVELTAKPIIAS